MKWIKKTFRIVLWTVLLSLLLVSGISIYFYFQKDVIINAAIRQFNEQLTVPIDVHQVDVSFRHFPRLSVLFTQVRCSESGTQRPELLLSTERVTIRFSLADVLFSRYYINEIGLENGYVHIKIFEDGSHNFSIFKTDTSSASSTFEIEKLHLKNIQLTFSDFREKMFTSQLVYQAELSAAYKDWIQIKGHWNAQNRYVKAADWIVEDPIGHRADAFFRMGDNSWALQLDKASIDAVKFDLKYNRQDAEQEFQIQLKNQTIFSNQFTQNILKKYVREYQVKNDVITCTFSGKNSGENWRFSTEFTARAKNIIAGTESLIIDELKLAGRVYMDTNEVKATISNIVAQSAGTKISGDLMVFHKKNTTLSGTFSIDGEPNGIARLIGAGSQLNGNGSINAAGNFTYTIENKPVKKQNASLPVQVDCTLRSDKLELFFGENVVIVPALNLRIDNQGFNLRQTFTINDRSVDTDLQIRGLAGWIADSSAFLEAGGVLSIRRYDPSFWKSDSGPKGSVWPMLNRLRINLNLITDEYETGQLKCTDLNALVVKSGNDIEIKSLRTNLFGGSLEFQGILSLTPAELIVKGKSRLQKIELSQLMLGFNDFEQSTLTHKNLFGRLSGTVDFSLPMSHDIDPDFKKLKADMDIRITHGRLLNFEPMRALGRFADVEELKDIRFEELINKLSIENQMIRIPQFEIRSNALNLILEGSHSFENAVDYKVGLSLSDIVYQKRKRNRSVSDLVFEEDDKGARIWIRISGTTDQPRITPIKAELVRSRNQLLTRKNEVESDTTSSGSKPSKSPFKFEWDEN
ncbi:MAG: AsmA-like C-terminal region-containing protein [Thermaurantimonas sp.]